ncbi:HAD family hydrolase [Rhodopirellula sp. MGV]|uniref:HAD family hydrolase n=1 Tax=Rhodopirellula sp. MGV TaxID=2023130 RepID=UPI000B968291|nr:HAD family hydrolase [Rhodopirellula sp. MGV]OYP30474.1 haloacid dehalogenase [Rhodopirellula sp. MGV]PNY33542.1 haloacid dehalogenase-like hydrolase [Rhodopirellula baltica]
MNIRLLISTLCIFALSTLCSSWSLAQDPLPSWNDGKTKQAILSFVERVTDESSTDFVPPAERIATFDNDGTLWSEKPAYFQLLFIVDRVKSLSAEHPEWQHTEPFASILKGDLHSVAASGKPGLMKLFAATHAGMTVDEFSETVTTWLETSRHPSSGKRYDEMIYQPMLELLSYLRANGFKTYIVSGGGIEFMRPWAYAAYGIPPEQVVGSSLKLKYEVRDGTPVLVKLPEVDLIDDKEGKPVGIQSHIGRRPIFAGGNSDGDYQMMQWTTAGEGSRFALLVHHTDADREWAYDKDSAIGKLDKGLQDAAAQGWTVVDMKADWKTIYPWE